MADLEDRKYIRWDAEGVEVVTADEQENIDQVISDIHAMQAQQWDKHRHCFGGTHARTHAIVKGKFIVMDNLPPHLRQTELFSKGGEYDVVCRVSTEMGDPGMDDHAPVRRGFAMKILGVDGDYFEAGKDFKNIDMEFNSSTSLDLATAAITRQLLDLRLKYGGDPAKLQEILSKAGNTNLLKVRLTHAEGLSFWSQSAYRFGDHIFKFALFPNTEEQKKRYDQLMTAQDPPDVVHTWMQEFFASHEGEWLFRVQLCENLEDQPVEYAGKEWDDTKYPWQTVAKLVIPKQESFGMKRKAFWEDHLTLDPWRGLKSMQPLGSSNRLRRQLYPASRKLRRTMNAKHEIVVRCIDEFPDDDPNEVFE